MSWFRTKIGRHFQPQQHVDHVPASRSTSLLPGHDASQSSPGYNTHQNSTSVGGGRIHHPTIQYYDTDSKTINAHQMAAPGEPAGPGSLDYHPRDKTINVHGSRYDYETGTRYPPNPHGLMHGDQIAAQDHVDSDAYFSRPPQPLREPGDAPLKSSMKPQTGKAKGNKPRYGPRIASDSCVFVTLMILLPCLMFTTIVCLRMFTYHSSPILGWFFMLTFLGCAASFAFVGARKNQNVQPSALDKKPKGGGSALISLAVLCVFGTLVGAIAGTYGYNEFALRYWSCEENRIYTNVVPSSSAVAHSDAGTLVFSKDSRVDLGKSAAYVYANVAYCVAPVVGGFMSGSSGKMEFWAVGQDCCLGSGFTCGASLDSNAKGAVVVGKSSTLFPGRRARYLKAAKQAAAIYDLALPEEPLFLEWVSDPQIAQDGFWKQSMYFVFASAGVYLLVSCSVAALVQLAGKHIPGVLLE